MNRITRIVILTLIMSCPVFTLLFMFPMNLWVQLIAALLIALAIALPMATSTSKQ